MTAPSHEPGWRADLWRVGIILLAAAGVRAWMVSHAEVPSRDCLVFVRYALHLEDPPTDPADPSRRLAGPVEVIRKGEHPPGYPAAILLASRLVCPLAGGVTGDSMTLSAQLVSALSALLFVFPAYSLAKRLFDRDVAFVAVGLYELLPVFVEVTSDGISDGLFLLTAIIALWFAVIALKCEISRDAFAAGLLAGFWCGLGYLIRPDGVIVAAAIGLSFAGASVVRFRTKGRALPIFLAGVGLTVGVVGVVGPYVAVIGKLSNKPSAGGLLDSIQGDKPNPTYFQRQSFGPAPVVPLAAWWDPVAFQGQNQSVWAAKELFKEYSKAAHYVIPVFAIVGLVWFRRRLFDARIALLVVLAVLHLAVLWLLAAKIGYVSQRHTLLIVFVTCLFGAAALPVVGRLGVRWWKRGTDRQWGAMLALLLVASAVPRDIRTFHAERAGHRQAGQWLAEHADQSSPVVDPFGWAEFYSGRTVRGWTTANPYRGPTVYSVVEPNAKSHHSRLPWLEPATRLMAQGELVFQYPAGVPADQIHVAVYKSPPLKP